MNMQLKSMIRKPITAILLVLLLGIVSFGFVSKMAEYLVVKEAIEDTSKYYRSIGYLSTTSAGGGDATEGARFLADNELIDFYEIGRICSGTLDDMYNSDLDSVMSFVADSNTAETVFWGRLIHKEFISANVDDKPAQGTYLLKFKVTEQVYGYPEYAQINEEISLNYSPEEAAEEFAVVFESLQTDQVYAVKTYQMFKEGMQLRQILPEDKWFLTEAEVDRLSEVIAADTVQETNRHRIYLTAAKDMSALPNMQESVRYSYLTDGRWIDKTDNESENPVCVIHQQMAETRNLAVGDTLTITMSDEQLEAVYYPAKTEINELPEETITKTFTIVGVFNTMNNGGSYSSVDGLYVYIPDSCMPNSYDADREALKDGILGETSYSFVLKSPEMETDFVEQYREPLKEMGYTLNMIENGWAGFNAAAEPIRQSDFYSAVIFAAVQLFGILIAAYLYFRQHRREFAIARALGVSSKRIVGGHIVPTVLIGILGIGVGSLMGWKYALLQVTKIMESLLMEGQITDVNLSSAIFVGLIVISLLLLLISVMIQFIWLSKKPVLEILHGAAKNNGKKK